MSQAPLLADTPYRQERVLVIYTGGTIGMQPQANGLSPAGHFFRALRQGTESTVTAGSIPASRLRRDELLAFDRL